jgi:phosphoenolpyruvate carboxykinase (ATP)
MAIVMDFANRVGLVFGSAYGGSVKKLMFTVMNYYLPLENILPFTALPMKTARVNFSLFFRAFGYGKPHFPRIPKGLFWR